MLTIMIGSLLGAGIGAGAKIFGGIKAAKEMRKMRRDIERQKRDNQAWYDRRYNEDATQRADAQRILTMTEDAIKRRNKAAQGAQAVMGGTNEGVAAAQAANSQALADATSQIAVAADQRKDAIENQYMGRQDALDNQLHNLQAAKAQNIQNAAQGVADAAAQAGAAYDQWQQHNEDNALEAFKAYMGAKKGGM